MPEIVQVIGRANQGSTRPFLCIADDHNTYYVKGRGAGTRSLIAELIAGSLALRLELAVAPFEVLEVSKALLQGMEIEDARDLGVGAVFGSRKIDFAREIAISDVEKVDSETQHRVFAFDWWIQNADRNLTRAGGNPNIMWTRRAPVLIDHNLAFDNEYSLAQQLDAHVFAETIRLRADWISRDECRRSMNEALTDWDGLLARIPDQWWFADDERTVPTDFDVELAHNILRRCEQNQLWGEP